MAKSGLTFEDLHSIAAFTEDSPLGALLRYDKSAGVSVILAHAIGAKVFSIWRVSKGRLVVASKDRRNQISTSVHETAEGALMALQSHFAAPAKQTRSQSAKGFEGPL